MELQLKEVKPYQPKIHTQILDPTLPSELLDNPSSNATPKSSHPFPPHPMLLDSSLCSYTIRGKCTSTHLPKYQKNSYLHLDLPTFCITIAPTLSKGLKGLWENIIGYGTRELYLNEGYGYVLQRKGEGYHVHQVWVLERLFQVFWDKEDNKVRLVFHKSKTLTDSQDFQAERLMEILDKLKEELQKIGRQML